MINLTINERKRFEMTIVDAGNDAIFEGLNFLKYEYLPIVADGDKRIFTKAQDVEILLLSLISVHSFLLNKETELNSLQISPFNLTLQLLDKIRSHRIYDDSPDLNIFSISNVQLKENLKKSDQALQNLFKMPNDKVLSNFLMRMKSFMEEKNKYIISFNKGDFSFYPNMLFTSIFIQPFIEKGDAERLLKSVIDDFSSSTSLLRSTADGYSLRLAHREFFHMIEQLEKKVFQKLYLNNNLNKVLDLHMKF